jgi:hypothetical protein
VTVLLPSGLPQSTELRLDLTGNFLEVSAAWQSSVALVPVGKNGQGPRHSSSENAKAVLKGTFPSCHH